MKNRFSDQHGFTLIELMIVIAMVSVLSAIAVPRFNAWLPTYRLKSAASDLQSNLQKARIQAIKDNRSLQVRFDRGAIPGFYYFDLDEDGAFDAGEFRVDLDKYGSGVDFGVGTAVQNWNGDAIAEATIVTFGSRGTAIQRTIYLDNQNGNVCYALTTSIAGSVKSRKFDGTNWE